jgi:hypothetical protein
MTAAGQMNGKEGIMRQKSAALLKYISVALVYIICHSIGTGNLRIL